MSIRVIEVSGDGNIGEKVKEMLSKLENETGKKESEGLGDIIGGFIAAMVTEEIEEDIKAQRAAAVLAGRTAVSDAFNFIEAVAKGAQNYLDHARECEKCGARTEVNEKAANVVAAASTATEALQAFIKADGIAAQAINEVDENN